jgi:hypothetical protein
MYMLLCATQIEDRHAMFQLVASLHYVDTVHEWQNEQFIEQLIRGGGCRSCLSQSEDFAV